MRLKVLDQVHVSSVQPDALRPGQEIKVTPEEGEALLSKLPAYFEQLESDQETPPAPEAAEGEKAEPAPPNKAAPARKNKASA